MPEPSKLNKRVSMLGKLPKPLREKAVSFLMGKVVPFVGTASLKIEEMTEERVVVTAPNRRGNRNHIGSVHAAAMVLAAETASGFVVAMSVPEGGVPLIKSLKVDFVKRSQGAIRAVATLTDEQRQKIKREPKGEVLVETVATDGSGGSPIRCEMLWAWVPKKR
jgi:acyl-coenzyme A thioesterase PaaI-like protein